MGPALSCGENNRAHSIAYDRCYAVRTRSADWIAKGTRREQHARNHLDQVIEMNVLQEVSGEKAVQYQPASHAILLNCDEHSSSIRQSPQHEENPPNSSRVFGQVDPGRLGIDVDAGGLESRWYAGKRRMHHRSLLSIIAMVRALIVTGTTNRTPMSMNGGHTLLRSRERLHQLVRTPRDRTDLVSRDRRCTDIESRLGPESVLRSTQGRGRR